MSGVSPVVAIVGRPNVGKSTLFNRMIQSRQAIEDRQPGVTRDRIYGRVEWGGKVYTVIDTGGITFGEDFPLDKQVQQQVDLAVEEAALILFVVDARDGITPLDQEIASYLRKTRKQILIIANKVDRGQDSSTYPLYELGLGEPVPVSATHGLGIGDLLELISEKLPQQAAGDYPPGTIKIAVTGRPNVGKSSLINKILGQERVIVNEIPGTTRDAVDVYWEFQDRRLVFVDTAGIRKKSKITGSLEYYSVLRSLKAVQKADLVLIVIDVKEGFTEQDQRIAGLAHEAGKGMVIVANKWDLIESEERDTGRFRAEIYRRVPFIPYVPVVFISALTGKGIKGMLDCITRVDLEINKRISTPVLNELLQDSLFVNPPPARGTRKLKIYYATQPQIKPPTFIFFVNNPELMHFSYLRYLENRLRESFGFQGVPIKLKVKKRSKQGG